MHINDVHRGAGCPVGPRHHEAHRMLRHAGQLSTAPAAGDTILGAAVAPGTTNAPRNRKSRHAAKEAPVCEQRTLRPILWRTLNLLLLGALAGVPSYAFGLDHQAPKVKPAPEKGASSGQVSNVGEAGAQVEGASDAHAEARKRGGGDDTIQSIESLQKEMAVFERIRSLKGGECHPWGPGGSAPRVAINLRAPGQVEDAETGLHYNWHRYYNPATGRYLSEDPLLRTIPGFGESAYSYARGNPMRYTDPDGRCPICVAIGVIVAEAIADVLVVGGTAAGVVAGTQIIDHYMNEDSSGENECAPGAPTGAPPTARPQNKPKGPFIAKPDGTIVPVHPLPPGTKPITDIGIGDIPVDRDGVTVGGEVIGDMPKGGAIGDLGTKPDGQ